MTRIDQTFARLKSEGKKAFESYIMAGDPDFETSLELVMGLPAAGVDIIELGLPFTDPMADGPTIQLAGGRSLNSGMTLIKTLEMAKRFREKNDSTPIVIMGYYNPIFSYGVEQFLTDAKSSGIDGLIVVDLPPEEDGELCIPAQAAGINFSSPPPKFRTSSLFHFSVNKELLVKDAYYVWCMDQQYKSFRITLYPNLNPNKNSGFFSLTV